MREFNRLTEDTKTEKLQEEDNLQDFQFNNTKEITRLFINNLLKTRNNS